MNLQLQLENRSYQQENLRYQKAIIEALERSGRNEPELETGETSINYQQVDSLAKDDLETRLTDIQVMRSFYKHYSPRTAKDIIGAIPKAYGIHCNEGGRWGPGIIARVIAISSTTIGRYLKAFRESGITKIEGVEIP